MRCKNKNPFWVVGRAQQKVLAPRCTSSLKTHDSGGTRTHNLGMAFFHCSLEVQCAIHCATEPGSGCFFYAPTATRTYLFPVSHRRPLRPLFTLSRGQPSVTTFDSSVGRAEDCSGINRHPEVAGSTPARRKSCFLPVFLGVLRPMVAKKLLPGRESNPGRGGESAESYTLDR